MKRRLEAIRSFAAHFAMRQVTGLVVVLDDADRAALGRIALDDRERAIGTKGLDGFRPAIVVVIANFTHQNPVQVLLNQVGLAIGVAIAFDLDDGVAFDGFDDVRFPIAVGIDRYLVFVFADPQHPLIGSAVGSAMSDDAIRAAIA